MKKSLISLYILIAHICAINLAYCAEDFFLDNKNFKEVNNIQKEKTQKKSFFSSIKEKFSKNSTNNDENKGYYGKLPNIERDFKYKQQTIQSSPIENAKIPTREELEEENLKKAPTDDTLFLDVIIKKEKSSTYVNDIQRIKFALNNLKKCIELNEDIRRFNGCVNVIDLYTKNLEIKYSQKPECYKESYIAILNVNYQSKLLGNLIYDSNYYSKYIPVQQGKYSENNIKLEKEKLLNKINKTLFLINNES